MNRLHDRGEVEDRSLDRRDRNAVDGRHVALAQRCRLVHEEPVVLCASPTRTGDLGNLAIACRASPTALPPIDATQRRDLRLPNMPRGGLPSRIAASLRCDTRPRRPATHRPLLEPPTSRSALDTLSSRRWCDANTPWCVSSDRANGDDRVRCPCTSGTIDTTLVASRREPASASPRYTRSIDAGCWWGRSQVRRRGARWRGGTRRR